MSRSSSRSPVMNHRGLSYRFDRRRPTIVAGWRSCGSTPRAVRSKIGVRGTTRLQCFRRLSSSNPIRSRWPAVCAVCTSGPSGRPDLAVEYGKRVLAAEPGDSETLSQLVEYYRRSDPSGAVSILNEVLANPKLEQHAFGRLLAHYELGRLYSGRLHQTDKAADAFAKVVEELDDKSANRLTPVEVFGILGDSPATAYFNFATVFLAAKRDELAVKALEHGLLYDEDNTQISLILADTLLKLNRGEQALCAGRSPHRAADAVCGSV